MRRPSGPTPYCILAHPQQLLTVCKARVDGPTPPAHAHLGCHSGVKWRMAQGGLPLPRRAVPTQHHPDVRPWQGVPHGHHPQGGTRRHPGALPALLVWRAQAAAGSAAATASTGRASGAPSTRRSRGGRRPRPGGPWVGGRTAPTRGRWGTSAQYPRPSPVTPSRQPGLPPNASSAPPTATAAPGS